MTEQQDEEVFVIRGTGVTLHRAQTDHGIGFIFQIPIDNVFGKKGLTETFLSDVEAQQVVEFLAQNMAAGS